ncbi:MAG: acyl-CoA dehydrogenase family protein [Chloroflexi bacterium]|nr:acyl-CoA dehydrogenase family protein [Chloroflexota bacterium]
MDHRSYAYGKNHWLLDPDLRPILSKHWPHWVEHEAALIDFGNVAGGRAYEVAEHIDRGAVPVLVMHAVDGNRIDRVRLSPAHAALLKDIAFINRAPYEGGSWHQHFALGYLLADPGLYCSLIVTNQTAYAIYKYLPDQQHWLQPLLSGDAWGATWMTETHGGSDLGANKTLARLNGDGWQLYGDDKYFASNAGLADVAIVTARPEGAPPGPKGIALFLVPRIAPRLNSNGQLNYHVRRLKDKSATRAVPSGEVEFDGAQAFLVGQKELGIYYTLENLTVSRLANAAGAMGLARKAQLESLFRTQARSAFGKPIIDHPLVRYDLTDLAVRIAGGLALLFHAVAWFDRVWRETPPYSERYHYARFLSHLLKNRTAEHGAAATQLAMELFGGIGFLDDFPIARLHRESLVTIIWEGTSNIQALDMLEAIRKKSAHESFLDEMLPMLDRANTPEAKQTRRKIEDDLKHLLTLEPAEAQWHSKDVLRTLADGAQVALLYDLAQSAGERYAKLAALYARRFLQHESFPAWALNDREVWCPLNLTMLQ